MTTPSPPLSTVMSRSPSLTDQHLLSSVARARHSAAARAHYNDDDDGRETSVDQHETAFMHVRDSLGELSSIRGSGGDINTHGRDTVSVEGAAVGDSEPRADESAYFSPPRRRREDMHDANPHHDHVGRAHAGDYQGNALLDGGEDREIASTLAGHGHAHARHSHLPRRSFSSSSSSCEPADESLSLPPQLSQHTATHDSRHHHQLLHHPRGVLDEKDGHYGRSEDHGERVHHADCFDDDTRTPVGIDGDGNFIFDDSSEQASSVALSCDVTPQRDRGSWLQQHATSDPPFSLSAAFSQRHRPSDDVRSPKQPKPRSTYDTDEEGLPGGRGSDGRGHDEQASPHASADAQQRASSHFDDIFEACTPPRGRSRVHTTGSDSSPTSRPSGAKPPPTPPRAVVGAADRPTRTTQHAPSRMTAASAPRGAVTPAASALRGPGSTAIAAATLRPVHATSSQSHASRVTTTPGAGGPSAGARTAARNGAASGTTLARAQTSAGRPGPAPSAATTSAATAAPVTPSRVRATTTRATAPSAATATTAASRARAAAVTAASAAAGRPSTTAATRPRPAAAASSSMASASTPARAVGDGAPSTPSRITRTAAASSSTSRGAATTSGPASPTAGVRRSVTTRGSTSGATTASASVPATPTSPAGPSAGPRASTSTASSVPASPARAPRTSTGARPAPPVPTTRRSTTATTTATATSARTAATATTSSASVPPPAATATTASESRSTAHHARTPASSTAGPGVADTRPQHTPARARAHHQTPAGQGPGADGDHHTPARARHQRSGAGQRDTHHHHHRDPASSLGRGGTEPGELRRGEVSRHPPGNDDDDDDVTAEFYRQQWRLQEEQRLHRYTTAASREREGPGRENPNHHHGHHPSHQGNGGGRAANGRVHDGENARHVQRHNATSRGFAGAAHGHGVGGKTSGLQKLGVSRGGLGGHGVGGHRTAAPALPRVSGLGVPDVPLDVRWRAIDRFAQKSVVTDEWRRAGPGGYFLH